MRSPCELQRIALTPATKMERGGLLTICESTAASPTSGFSPGMAEAAVREESRGPLSSLSNMIGNIFKKDRSASPLLKKRDSDDHGKRGSGVEKLGETKSDGKSPEQETPTEPGKTPFSFTKGERTTSPVQGEKTSTTSGDFFADEAQRAEVEQEFLKEILASQDHTPTADPALTRSATNPDEMRREIEAISAGAPTSPKRSQTVSGSSSPKISAASPAKSETKQSPANIKEKYAGSTSEKMLKEAIERHDNLKKTEESTRRMADSAAEFAATMAAASKPKANVDESGDRIAMETNHQVENQERSLDDEIAKRKKQKTAQQPVEAAAKGKDEADTTKDSSLKKKPTRRSTKRKFWVFG